MSTQMAEKIDQRMEKASEALSQMLYYEAERLANKALNMAREANDFERMARIALPLQEARRQRMQQAIDAADGEVRVLDEPVTEEMKVDPGCYLVQPMQVGADARRLRLAAFAQESPVLVVCCEPETDLGFQPVVAISPGLTLRAKVDPPDDPDAPDIDWLLESLEALGDAAINNLDPELATVKCVDALVHRLDAVPEHEKLHQALAEACRDAAEEQAEELREKKRKAAAREKKKKSKAGSSNG